MSDKPILILHPGHSKCGSSSIQSALYNQEEHLKKQGIYLPDSRFQFSFEKDRTPAKVAYPLLFFKDIYEERIELSQFQERLDAVLQQAADSDCKSIVVSAENLSLLRRIPLNHKLQEILASNFQTIKVIYYMRRQDDWIVSCWQQWGHKDGTSLDKMVERFLKQNVPTFSEIVDSLKEIYGETKLSVVPLDRSAFHNGDLISDFYHRVGIELSEELIESNVVNSALNPYFCDFLSSIPNLYKSVHDNSIKGLLASYVSDQSALFRRHKGFLPLNLRHKIMAHFYQENQELHQQFFPSLDFDVLFGIDETLESASALSEVEVLKEVMAIQTEILIGFIKRNKHQRG